jgi:hypothetical protein
MEKSFTGEEFVKRLSEGALRNPVVREGMVKPSEHAVDEIQFSVGRSCRNWTAIPAHLIERVEFITEVACKDHRHPFVRLIFTEPQAENKQATVLADLLRGSAPTVPLMQQADIVPDDLGVVTTASPPAVGVTNRLRVGDAPGAWPTSRIGPIRRCPPPGTCEKASQWCRRGDEKPWCDILRRCMDCDFEDPPPPPPPPSPNPCPRGWTWVSGPFDCPTCCRDIGGGLSQCTYPLCSE